jgi:hypothetical protein
MQAQFAQQHAQARHGYYIGGPRAGPDAFKLTSTLDKCTAASQDYKAQAVPKTKVVNSDTNPPRVLSQRHRR